MKKLLSILLAVSMILSFAACNNDLPDDSSNSTDIPTDTKDPPQPTETPTDPDTTTTPDFPTSPEEPTNTETPPNTEAPVDTDPPVNTENTEKTPSEPSPMMGFVLDTEIYTTRFENGKDIHLEGMDSGVYTSPDRSTSCGSLPDGTKVRVLEVGFEGDDITVGWARILAGASKWEVYIRTSQLKCFVLHETAFPVAPEELIGKSQLISLLPMTEKNAISASFLALGYRTAFMEDGSTMFISNENFEDQLIQNADGSWIEYDGEGGVNQYFDCWKYSLLEEYGIPTDRNLSEMKILLLGISSAEGVAINFAPTITLDNVKAYAEKLKSFGYTLQSYQAENEDAYLYVASNQTGYAVQLAYTKGQSAMTVKKTASNAFNLTEFIQSGDILGNYPSEKLDEFERMIEANGGRLEHRAKSLRLVFPDGTAEQFFDGSWLLETDTLASTTGGYFPQNEYTAQLMSVYPSTYGFKNGETTLYKQEKTFLATFSDATVDKAKQFTSALIIRGAFHLNVKEAEGVNDGIAVYTFYAESYNYAIEFSCVEGSIASMQITSIQ